MAHDVFISHAAADEAIALACACALDARGLRSWIAVRDMDRARGAYASQVSEALRAAPALLQIVTRGFESDRNAATEIALAHERGVPVVEFIVDPAIRPRRREHLVARTAPVASHAQRLAVLIRRMTAGGRGEIREALPPPPPPAAPPGPQPLAPPPWSGEEEVPPADQVSAGLILGGRFRLEARIGQGGAAALFTARDLELNRPAVVKLFALPTVPGSAVARGLEERLGALASLHSPHVAPLLAWGAADLDPGPGAAGPLWFIATQMIPGRDLATWGRAMDHGPEAGRRRLELAAGVARGLAALHGHGWVDALGFVRVGLVHGDLKPANVIVEAADQPVIVDLLVAELGSRGGRPASPGYAAPELLAGAALTPAGDLYALGRLMAVLFRPDLETEADSGRLADLLDDDLRVPPAYAELVRRLTAADPGLRPRTAAEVAAELEALVPELRARATVVALPPRPHDLVHRDPLSWFETLRYDRAVPPAPVQFHIAEDLAQRDRIAVSHWLGVQMEAAGALTAARRLLLAADRQYAAFGDAMHGAHRHMIADPLDRCRLDVKVRLARVTGHDAEDGQGLVRDALELALRVCDTLFVGRTCLVSNQGVFEVPVPAIPDPLDLLAESLTAFRARLPAAARAGAE